MNDNSYAGREYLSNLCKNNIKVDVLNIGKFPVLNTNEEKRCGNLWKPDSVKSLLDFHHFHYFNSLKSKDLLEFLKKQNYDLGIQGGTGILKLNIICNFKSGILNFHPGDLPLFRGCSAPEWQFFENKPIISTCHLIDEGIDTGPVLKKKKLNVCLKSYESFRASIYPETSVFVSEVIQDLMNKKIELKFKPQDEKMAIYRKYFGDDSLLELKSKFI